MNLKKLIMNHICQKRKLKYDIPIKPLEKIDEEKVYVEIKNKYLQKIQLIKDNKKLTDKRKDTKIKTLITKQNKEIVHIGKVTKSKKYILEFDSEQKILLRKWMLICEKVYNKCVELYNKDMNSFDLNFQSCKLNIFKQVFNDDDKDCPYDTLTDEVKTFCSNVKSCLTNIKNGNTKHYKMKNKNTLLKQTILVPITSVSENGIFSKLLGDNNVGIIEREQIKGDCKLTYNKLTKQFMLFVPCFYHIKNLDNRNKVVALDPGEKIFMAYYGIDECGKIGDNIRIPILRYERIIRKMQRDLKNKKNHKKHKLHNKRKLKIKIQNEFNNIKNLVKELHNKTALFLCKNYDNILLPKFETQKMVVNCDKEYLKRGIYKCENKEQLKEKVKFIRLSKRVKFTLNMLSHYKFKQHLLTKCQEYGCNLVIVDESYTSQCCGKCGMLSQTYDGRTKECDSCHMKINRDLNGARNILLKNISLVQ